MLEVSEIDIADRTGIDGGGSLPTLVLLKMAAVIRRKSRGRAALILAECTLFIVDKTQWTTLTWASAKLNG